MPYDEDTKVFDVAKPTQARPDASGRPVIVGHRPQMSDPMVKDQNMPSTPATPIHVAMADEDDPHTLDEEPTTETPTEPEPEKDSSEQKPDYVPVGSLISSEVTQPNSEENNNAPQNDSGDSGHDDGSSLSHVPPLSMSHGAGPKRRWPKILAWILIILLVIVVAVYLAIDDGLIQSNIKLPFHIFNKQKTSNSSVAPPASPPPAINNPTPASTIPSGFAAYNISGTGISFDYPTSWGTPTTTTDPGYSKRGGTNKSDGTYAYLVNFATNKDVQLALTSPKYLPVSRSPLYYDYLQWCTGTNDGQIYKQAMVVDTTSGVDTPGTVVCDQGPLTDATKIDNQTIEQLKTKYISGDQAGQGSGAIVTLDLYTKNLSSTNWPVLRVADFAMSSGDNIKKLLPTVQVVSGSDSSSSNNSSSTTP